MRHPRPPPTHPSAPAPFRATGGRRDRGPAAPPAPAAARGSALHRPCPPRPHPSLVSPSPGLLSRPLGRSLHDPTTVQYRTPVAAGECCWRTASQQRTASQASASGGAPTFTAIAATTTC